ncbi:MAG: two-partner secretion domain-containing protein, partial [Ramlibacter sp.]
ARSQPAGAQAVVGTASLSQQGSRLVVTTQNGAGGYSSINWQSFSVPAGSSTYFAQPGAASTSINRVVGPDPSAIYGTLSSNGRLVLVNPAGITVGPGAVVDTAGFTASTLRMGDADARAGRLRFDGSAGGVLRVDGQVLARSGDVVLIGQDVRTGAAALVQSPQGATVLAAGQKVEVTGRGLEGIVFEVQAPTDQTVNLGTLRGDAVGVFAGTLRHSGLVQAQAVSTEGGRVVLRAVDQALVAGAVVAQGVAGTGGRVDVLGPRVGVLAGASIDTSNTGGGGQIRVGGDAHGGNALVPNAQVAYVDAGAQLRANATDRGDGGKVVVWADDTTRMHGSIEAKAGPRGGDGGFVETSGKRLLDANGARVVADAPRGMAGTWLLDPDDITIAADPAATPSPSPAPQNIGGVPGPDFSPSPAGGPSVVYDSTLTRALNAGTNVSVTTDAAYAGSGSGSGDILFAGNVNLARTVGGRSTLTLNAWNDIVFQSGSTVNFQAAAAPVPTSAPVASQLDVVLNAQGRITTQSGAAVQLSVADPAAGDQVRVLVAGGKTWTNGGTLDLGANTQLLLHDGASAATLVNNGTLTGNPGANGGIGGASPSQLGALVNAGTVTLPSGTLSVASLTQTTAGSLALGGTANLTVNGAFDAAAGSFAFNGNALSLSQDSGDLTLAGNGAAITATGPVSLVARNGNVVIGRGVGAAGEMAIGAGNADLPNGTITLNAAVSADKLLLSAWGQDATGSAITQTAPVSARELMVFSNAGKAVLTDTGNTVQAVAASAPALDLVNRADLLTIKPLSNSLGGTLGGLQYTGAVRITNNAASATPGSGSVLLDAGGTVWLDSLAITAAGSIRADTTINTFGKYDPSVAKLGDVDLTANAGTVTHAGISTVGGAIGTQATAGGSVTLTAAAGVAGGAIATSGVPSADGSMGAAGGNVAVRSTTGDIALGDVRASGSTAGGHGGTVSIAAAAGNLTVGAVDTSGGSDYSGLGLGGSAGAIQLSAGGAGKSLVTGGLSATGGYTYGAQGGAGGPIQVTSSGDVAVAGWIDTYGGSGSLGGAGGQASLASTGGNVHVDYGIDSSGGDSSAAVGGSAGSVRLTTAAGGISVGGRIDALGGSGSAGGGAGGLVSLGATGGGLLLGAVDASGGYSGSGAGGSGGVVRLTSSGSASVASVQVASGLVTDGGWGATAGGQAGSVTVAASGDVVLGAGSPEVLAAQATSTSYAYGSAVSTSGGSGGQAGGGAGGAVTLASSAGNLFVLGDLSSRGGDGGGANGGAGGPVSATAPGAVVVGWIDSSGGSTSSGNGGNAGNITLSGGTGMGLSFLQARGGGGGGGPSAGGRGGNGGSTSITLGSGDLFLDNVGIDLGGGWGGAHASLGGNGGNGGTLTLRAAAGGVFTSGPGLDTYGSSISTEGGGGGDTSGMAATARGGAGGTGGAIRVVASGNSELLGDLTSRGGDGGHAPGAGSSAKGGAGGAAGAVSVTLSAPAATLALGGGVYAGGGAGGQAADVNPTTYAYDNVDATRTGATGATGTFAATAPGGVFVAAAPAVPDLAPSSGDAGSSLNVDARWTNNGTLALAPGAWVRNTQPFTNSGTLRLGGGSLLSLGAWDPQLQTFSPGGVAFTNSGTGVLQGSGTLQANVSNAGTISPGDAANPAGVFTIAGDLQQQSTGKLVFDIAANSPAIGGVTYDQLLVSGNVALGGLIQVNAIPAVAVAPAPAPGSSGLLARQLTTTTADNYLLITAGSTTAGSSFAGASVPADLQPRLQISSAGVVSALFVAAPAPAPAPMPAPTPAPAPAPTAAPVASDAPLVDKIVGMLDGDVARDTVQQAVAEQDNVVAKFLTLLLTDEGKQKQDAGRKDAEIVTTDTACKPS